ncbi:cell wall anchor protein [Gracilibacillus sp. YIM 98692]|uniref:cell wall anchor protein n=1 Tax=Gracilibacillus sp. YIM 98692 TaxID=2663532 RepID=UPI0013D19E5A|nr:cell wall anchor protein [Gracilibacillus sp. YIM 98692]
MKKFSIVLAITVLLVGLLPFSVSAENSSAQKLADSIAQLGVDEVDYLYAYLQSIDLTEEEYNSIVTNTERAAEVTEGKSHPTDFSNAEKTELLSLFNDSTQKAHLDVQIVDHDGNSISLSDYNFDNGVALNIQDLEGNQLATVNPTIEDLNPGAISTKVDAIKTAVDAKVELDETGEFVPMPEAELPNTASNLPTSILIGGIVALLGVIGFIPAVKLSRKVVNAN